MGKNISKHIVIIVLSLSFLILSFNLCKRSTPPRRKTVDRTFQETHSRKKGNKNQEVAAKKKSRNRKKKTKRTSQLELEKPIAGKRRMYSSPELFEKYASAVFMVFCEDENQTNSQGSGFFINSKGIAVSNYHVFSGNSDCFVKLHSGKCYFISNIVALSEEDDIIIFQVDVPTSVNFFTMATNLPRIGEKVHAIGSPKGLQNTFSSGEVSQIRGEKFIQISVPIDHGSSGGALINEYGEVVGITTSGIDSNANLNFAVSINAVKEIY